MMFLWSRITYRLPLEYDLAVDDRGGDPRFKDTVIRHGHELFRYISLNPLFRNSLRLKKLEKRSPCHHDETDACEREHYPAPFCLKRNILSKHKNELNRKKGDAAGGCGDMIEVFVFYKILISCHPEVMGR